MAIPKRSGKILHTQTIRGKDLPKLQIVSTGTHTTYDLNFYPALKHSIKYKTLNFTLKNILLSQLVRILNCSDFKLDTQRT